MKNTTTTPKVGKKELAMNLVSDFEKYHITPATVTKADMAEWHLHVANSNGKVKAPCVSLIGGKQGTCACNVPCDRDCYAKHGPISWPHRKRCVYLNWLLWQADPERFEAEVIEALKDAPFARFHDDGDIPDPSYIDMTRRVSRECANTRIWLMNKRMGWVNANIAEHGMFDENLVYMASNWGRWRQDNPYRLPVFWVVLKDGSGKDLLPDTARMCPGDCDTCKKGHCGCPYAKCGDVMWINQHR